MERQILVSYAENQKELHCVSKDFVVQGKLQQIDKNLWQIQHKTFTTIEFVYGEIKLSLVDLLYPHSSRRLASLNGEHVTARTSRGVHRGVLRSSGAGTWEVVRTRTGEVLTEITREAVAYGDIIVARRNAQRRRVPAPGMNFEPAWFKDANQIPKHTRCAHTPNRLDWMV